MFSEYQMLEILKEDPVMLKVWQEDYPEIKPTQACYDYAVSRAPWLLELVPPEYQTEEMCLQAVSDDYTVLKHVHDQTLRVIDAAFAEYNLAKSGKYDERTPGQFNEKLMQKRERYPESLLFSPLPLIRHQTRENLMCAVSYDGSLIGEVPLPLLDDDMKCIALRQDPGCYLSIPHGRYSPPETERVAIAALEAGVELWKIRHPQTPEICQTAVRIDPEAVKYVKDPSMLEDSGPRM